MRTTLGDFLQASQRATFLGILIIMAGCAADEGEETAPAGPRIQEQQSGKPPASYTLTNDSSCRNSGPIETATIHHWQGDEVVPRQVTLEGVETIDGMLTGPGVPKITYKDTYERFCDATKSEGSWCRKDDGSEMGWRPNKDLSPGGLAVCPDGEPYPRESYEAVGLASLYYVEKAAQAYKDHAGTTQSPVDLPPLQLSILPHFVTYYDFAEENGVIPRHKVVMTNNMAYFPSVPMIAAFPHPEDFKDDFAGFFWESAFVLAHEFGHHIDHSRGAFVCSSLGLVWNPLTHAFDDPELDSYTLLGGGTARAKVCGAVAEAFADLLAYYAGDGDTAAVSGLPCFGYNRTVPGPDFENGDRKILTEDRYNVLLGLADPEQEPACGRPHYGDIHIIGAVFAHTIDRVFAELVQVRDGVTPGSPEDFGARYDLTLAWLDAIKKEIAAKEPVSEPEEYLIPLRKGLEKVTEASLAGFQLAADKTPEDVRSSVCGIFAEGVPALPESAFATSSCEPPLEAAPAAE